MYLIFVSKLILKNSNRDLKFNRQNLENLTLFVFKSRVKTIKKNVLINLVSQFKPHLENNIFSIFYFAWIPTHILFQVWHCFKSHKCHRNLWECAVFENKQKKNVFLFLISMVRKKRNVKKLLMKITIQIPNNEVLFGFLFFFSLVRTTKVSEKSPRKTENLLIGL